MARRFEGLTRALGGSSLASVAYGEIGSSLYFALGVVALYALGLTPLVLLVAGVVFLLVAVSYAEGTAAIPEPGGAALFVRRAFNDPAGFATGWVLLLDYLIVSALAALFVPHYLAALGLEELRDSPWDVVVGVAVVLALSAVRLVRRPQLYRLAVVVAVVAVVSHVLLIVLGFALLFDADAFRGIDLGADPAWDELAFALPLAMLAYTGLETVANLSAETKEPGRTLPRSLFAGIGAVVAVSVAIGVVGISAFPVENGTTALGEQWRLAPLAGIADAISSELPWVFGDIVIGIVALSGVVVLLAAVDDVDVGSRPSVVLARATRDASARVRAPASPHASLADRDRRDGGRHGRAHRPQRHRRPLVGDPRESLQLRRPARVHGRSARRGEAATGRAGSAAPVPRAVDAVHGAGSVPH